MDVSSLPDAVWIEHGPAMFSVMIGGDDVWKIMVMHWQGSTWSQVEEQTGVPRVTARRWAIQAKMKMRQAGLNADAIGRCVANATRTRVTQVQ